MKRNDHICRECDDKVTRREWLQGAAGVAAASLGGLGTAACRAVKGAEVAPISAPDTTAPLIRHFYGTLSEKQRAVMCLPWGHDYAFKVDKNWRVTERALGELYTAGQRELLRDIFKTLVSEDGHARFLRVFEEDAGGFDQYSVALFGDPSTDQYEWVMTGRHLTMRYAGAAAGGGAVFGGPIFYGHGTGHEVGGAEEPDHPGNVWWKQARLANKVYASLDGAQRKAALLSASPPDDAKSIRWRAPGEYAGIAIGELSRDQKALVEEVMRDLLGPFRPRDVERAMTLIHQNGGFDQIHLAFYQEADLGSDGIWERWMLQGPGLSWYFRGSPHVHTWVNLGPRA